MCVKQKYKDIKINVNKSEILKQNNIKVVKYLEFSFDF